MYAFFPAFSDFYSWDNLLNKLCKFPIILNCQVYLISYIHCNYINAFIVPVVPPYGFLMHKDFSCANHCLKKKIHKIETQVFKYSILFLQKIIISSKWSSKFEITCKLCHKGTTSLKLTLTHSHSFSNNLIEFWTPGIRQTLRYRKNKEFWRVSICWRAKLIFCWGYW